MKIAIIHEMLIKLGGAERVIKKLLEMYPEADLYTLFHDSKKTDEWFKGQKIRTSFLQNWFKKGLKPKYLLPWMPKAIESFDFKKYDLVISSNSAFAHGIKTNGKTKHICYCHSPMRYAWDYCHEYPKGKSYFMKLTIAKILHPIRQWDYLKSDRPDLIIANSKNVQKRIQKYWRKKSQVIYPPVNTKRFKANSSDEDYFLIISALTPFKKIDIAIRAFNKLNRKLIIIGDGAQKKWLQSIAKKNIDFMGRKTDEVTKEYLENCRALIFPGEEDFGITPVEAMAAGKPVIAYKKGGVTESVQEGKSGLFFNELTVKSLSKAIEKFMLNESQFKSKSIKKNSERFDESIFEKEIKKVVNQIQK